MLRTIVTQLHDWQWIGIFVARLSVGLLFLLSGGRKLFVSASREQMRETLRKASIPFPTLNAVFVSMVEFIFGCCLLIGLVTPLACLMLSGVMIVAITTTAARNIKAPGPLTWLSEFLYLPEVLYLVLLLWIFLSGPGRVSIDHLLFGT